MEILDKLDASIGDILEKLDALRAENTRLKEESSLELELLREENVALVAQMAQEKQRTTTALARVEAVLQRLKERSLTE